MVNENGRNGGYRFVRLPALIWEKEGVVLTAGEFRLLGYLIALATRSRQDELTLSDGELMDGRRRADGSKSLGCGLGSVNTLKEARRRLELKGWLDFDEIEHRYRINFGAFSTPIEGVSEVDTPSQQMPLNGVSEVDTPCQKLTPLLSEVDTPSCQKLTVEVSEVDTHTKERAGGESLRESPEELLEKTPEPTVQLNGASEHQLLMDDYAKALGYRAPNGSLRVPNAGENGKAAKELLRSGYARVDIIGCYRWVKSHRFWSGQLVTLVQVSKQIGEWINQGRPERERMNGRSGMRSAPMADRLGSLLEELASGNE